MKKIAIVIFLSLFLVGCETQEERDNRIKKENIDKLQEEYKDAQMSDTAKDWLVETKLEKVVTILCLSSSKKCEEIKANYETLKNDLKINIEFIELDNVSDSDKSVYKTTYKLNDYASYVPYIFITNKGILTSTKTDLYKNEDLINYFKENKIITE